MNEKVPQSIELAVGCHSLMSEHEDARLLGLRKF